MAVPATGAVRIIGRYSLYEQIAAGGMASVHLGRLLGQAGFSRTVAIKRLHPHLAQDPEFVAMLIDEARLAARVRHPNVVATLDVVSIHGEVLVVMEYVHGQSLFHLIRTLHSDGKAVAPAIAVSIMAGALYGLHAAHEATSESGEPLGIIHRDVSPQNIMVGEDGVARVVDFGVAKAAGRLQETRAGQLKGKVRYMAPEQLTRQSVDRRVDVYAAGVVLWEALIGRRFVEGATDREVAVAIFESSARAPSTLRSGIPRGLDDAVLKALAKSPDDRFATAFELAEALEEAVAPATARQVARWFEETAPQAIRQRAQQLAEAEGQSARADATAVAEGGSDSDVSLSSPWVRPPSASRDKPPAPAADVAEPTEVAELGVGPDALAETPLVRGSTERLVLAGAALILIATTIVGLVFALGSRAAPASQVAATPGVQSSKGVAELAAAGTESALPVLVAPREPPGAASASAAPSQRARVPTAPKPPKPEVTKPKPSCNPPYYFDKDGVKHFRPECL